MTRLKFLLTNDDGIDAPGLAALEQALGDLGQLTILAPDRHLSGCAHQVTTHREIVLSSLGRGRYHLDGTPADCARIGLFHLCPEADWLISGINAGANLGADLYHSGTVAAAREAALLGRRAIAISRYIRAGVTVDWEQTSQWARRVVHSILAAETRPGTFWNVNLPCRQQEATPDIQHCPIDPSPLPVAYELQGDRLRYTGSYHDRVRHPGSDVDVCFGGRIAVTEVHLSSPTGNSSRLALF